MSPPLFRRLFAPAPRLPEGPRQRDAVVTSQVVGLPALHATCDEPGYRYVLCSTCWSARAPASVCFSILLPSEPGPATPCCAARERSMTMREPGPPSQTSLIAKSPACLSRWRTLRRRAPGWLKGFSLTLLAILYAAVPAHGQAPAAAAGEADVATAPIVIDGIELFSVRGVSSYPAQLRAQLIRDRIVAAAADPAVVPESLQMVDSDGSTRLMAGEHPIMAVVDADSALEGVARPALAMAHLYRVRTAIAEWRY